MMKPLLAIVCTLAFATFASASSTAPEPAPPPAAPAKRVEVDKTQQILRAYEAERLIIETHISTGKWDRSTTNGQFQVQSKERMHYSKRYNNAPMPYSVHVTGHVFIHGYKDVPDRPASHGCVRVPLTGDNPAKRFYEWVEIGTPVSISGRWEK